MKSIRRKGVGKVERKTTKVMIWLSCLLVLLAGMATSATAKAGEIKIYVEGKLLQFEGQQPLIRNGTTLVPFRKTFETLGYKVEWNAEEKSASGTKSGIKIELTMGSQSAKVNGQGVKLAVPAQIINGSTMIPLRFVSESSGYFVSYNNASGTSIIEITKEDTVLEPYVVKGRVVNSEGTPIKGAWITIDNQLLYDSNLQAKTDDNGRYRIALPKAATTYMAYADFKTVYEGVEHSVELTADDNSPFAGNTGAIRNFTVKLNSSTGTGGSGEVLFYMMDLIHPLNPIAEPPDRDDVTITLEPVGTMMDGTVGGPKLVSKGSRNNNGYGVHNVPIGQYRVSAVYAPPGEEPQQMLVRIVTRGEDLPFVESIVAGFRSITSKIHFMELELKLNVVKPPVEEPGEWTWGDEDEEEEEWTW
jgi:hypothetical protein